MPDLLLTALFGLAAVALGGPITVLVFRLVDRREPQAPRTPRVPILDQDTLQNARSTLRGGAWIGALERLAVYLAVVSDWKEALALALALKGLGRYPELRAGTSPAVAERFIIGTFVSVLWACGCAILEHQLTG